MYFPYFIAYIVIGFAITVPVFWWALKNNQFKDQGRARFLPLDDDSPRAPLASVSGIRRFEAYILLLFGMAGLLVSFSAVFYILLTGGK